MTILPQAVSTDAAKGPRLVSERREDDTRIDAGAVVRMSPPWTWSVVAIASCLVVTALLFASFAHVEVTARTRGVIRPAAGIRPLFAQSDAVIAEVFVASGQRVATGAPIVRLRSVDTESAQIEIGREVERAQRERDAVIADPNAVRQRDALLARVASAQSQPTSLRESVAHRQRRLDAMLELQRAGLVSAIQVDDAREETAQATRAVRVAEETIARAAQELAAFDAARERDLRDADRHLQEAIARRDALQMPLRRALVTAPASGIVEAMSVKQGDFLRAGQLLGRVLPDDGELQIVAFVAEKDRASLRTGDVARIELDQYPLSQYGALRARITRIAADLTTQQEVRDALGDGSTLEGSLVRVELQLLPAPDGPPVHTGMLLDVRLTLKKQRLATILLEPLLRSSR